MNKTAVAAIVALLGVGTVEAQQQNTLSNFQTASWEGIHLYGVSAFTSYVSSAFPLTTTNTVTPNANQLGYDLNSGVSASAGWQYRRGEKLTVAVLYTGSYNRSENFNSLSSFGHSLRANAAWQLSSKWTVDLSGNAVYQTLAEYLFQPNNLSVVAQSPVSINNVAAGVGIGQFSSAQAASSVGGALAPSATTAQTNPATGVLLGNRIFTYAAQASMSYQASRRLSFNLSGVTAAGQNRLGGSSNSPGQTFLVPRTMGINGGVSMNYALSTRTTVGVSVDGTRTSNPVQSAYTTMVAASVGRMMGMHWFLRASGGGSRTSLIQQQTGVPRMWETIGSGSVGYGVASQTFLANYNRSSVDSGGFGVGTNTSLIGAWNWRTPGRRYGLTVSGGQQQIRNTGFTSLTGWNGSVTWLMHMGDRLLLSTGYVYSNSTGTYLGSKTQISVNSIRMTLSWVPGALQAAVQQGSMVLGQ
jgi:hypothetical protein